MALSGRRDAGGRWTDAQALRDAVAAWSEFDENVRAEPERVDHVRVTVDGEQVHAVYERGKGPRPFPIVFTHGWPSTFWEYSALIPLLTDPAARGRSRGRVRCHRSFASRLWVLAGAREDGLRRRRRCRSVGAYSPSKVSGISGSALTAPTSALVSPHDSPGSIQIVSSESTWRHSECRRRRGRQRPRRLSTSIRTEWRATEGAYMDIQGTKPWKLGYALTDSPTASLRGSSRSTGRGATVEVGRSVDFRLEWTLTTLTIYWMTATATTSFKPYYTMRRTPPLLEAGSGCRGPNRRRSVPPRARPCTPSAPRSLVERHFNVTRWNEFPAGGDCQLPNSLRCSRTTFASSSDHFAGAMIVTVELSTGDDARTSSPPRRVPSRRRRLEPVRTSTVPCTLHCVRVPDRCPNNPKDVGRGGATKRRVGDHYRLACRGSGPICERYGAPVTLLPPDMGGSSDAGAEPRNPRLAPRERCSRRTNAGGRRFGTDTLPGGWIFTPSGREIQMDSHCWLVTSQRISRPVFRTVW